MTPVKFADFTGDRIVTGEPHRANSAFKANLNQQNMNLPRVPDWNSLHEHSHLRGEFEDVGEWQVPQIDVPGDRWLQSISISWCKPLVKRKRVRA